MKGLLRSLIVCLVTIGAVYVYTAYDEHCKDLDKMRWPSVEGRFVTEGDKLPAKVDGRVQNLAIESPSTGAFWERFFTFPYERFTYSVKGRTYVGERTGLPCLSSVREYCVKKEIAQQDRTPVYDAEVLNSLYSKVDPSTGELVKPSADETIRVFGPNSKVFYDPSAPQIAIIDPNSTSFVSSILFSGIAMCLLGAVLYLLIAWQEWMLRGTDFEERVPDYFYQVTSRYTGVQAIKTESVATALDAKLPETPALVEEAKFKAQAAANTIVPANSSAVAPPPLEESTVRRAAELN